MEKMMRSPENPRNKSIEILNDPIIPPSICPTWKLYENPFYISQNQPLQQDNITTTSVTTHNNKQIHRLQLPISARKIAASFWDLAFIRPLMDSELEMSRAQVAELKAKLENERKARKKMESLNKKLTKELSEERKGREALERVCEELANHVSLDKTEIERLRKEMEDERKMLRMAEVMREERVQMKLTEAKFLLEEKLLELEETKKMLETEPSNEKTEAKIQENIRQSVTGEVGYLADHRSVVCASASEGVNSSSFQYQVTIHRRNNSPEPENPHIKRGIKGFVEFPKVVRAIGSKSRHWGSKLECQKAQLRILLKQKCLVRSNGLLTS